MGFAIPLRSRTDFINNGCSLLSRSMLNTLFHHITAKTRKRKAQTRYRTNLNKCTVLRVELHVPNNYGMQTRNLIFAIRLPYGKQKANTWILIIPNSEAMTP